MKKCFFWFTKWFVRLIFRIFYRLRIYGKSHIPEGGAIIAVNHTSYYDPPIVGVSSPKEIHFLASDMLFENRFFAALISSLNAHPLSEAASNARVFRLVFSLLSKGKKVILFPEGGRQDKDEFGDIKPGMSLLVAKSETAFVPTYIEGAYQIWNRFQKLPKPFGKLVCAFGTPVYWKDYAHMDRKEAQVAMTKELEKAWPALRDWVKSGCHGTPP